MAGHGLGGTRPRPKDPKRMSATSSVLSRPAHQDEWPARRIAESFASRLESNVAVLSGIHFDDLNDSQIQEVNRLCQVLADEVLPVLENPASDRPRPKDILE